MTSVSSVVFRISNLQFLISSLNRQFKIGNNRMDAEQFDAALKRWLLRQLDAAGGYYHVQIKLWPSEVEMAQLTAADLPGWVIMGLGNIAAWGYRPGGQCTLPVSHPSVACTLEAVAGNLLHVQGATGPRARGRLARCLPQALPRARFDARDRRRSCQGAERSRPSATTATGAF